MKYIAVSKTFFNRQNNNFMRTFNFVNGKITPAEGENGAYVLVTEGEIKKGDVIGSKTQFSTIFSEVVRLTKNNAITADTAPFYRTIRNGQALPKEYSVLQVGAWVFRKK